MTAYSCNMLFAGTLQAVSLVLEKYKNKLL